jgi:glycosyltransferase involved in cell wall biosynthesis
MPGLSVIVITYNEEKNIERCLRSVSWADEIIVVDSFSTDRTIEIARTFTGTIMQYAYDGDIPQRERGFAAARQEWLLYIDADEEVSEALKNDILATISSGDAKEGYSIPRKVSILGRWIIHGGWYPDYTFRLFKKSACVAEPAEVHGGFYVRGEKGTLRGELYHYTYPTLEEYINKMNRYTSLQVSGKLREKPQRRIGAGKLILSPFSHFVRKYFSQKGYRDGVLGFILAVFGSIYTLALYAKIWEFQYRSRTGGELPPITNLDLQRVK